MNRAIRIVAATIGILFAIGGITHGYFETLQGNTPTNGPMIYAISDSMQTWEYGGEAAFTLMPTFILAGIASITMSILIITWCLRFLHTEHGATVFLGLFIVSFLVGGGIGQVAFFIPAAAFATRINKPLTWWRRVLSEDTRNMLVGIWPWTLTAGALLVFVTLEVAIFGYFPGVTDDEQLMNIVMGSLGMALILFTISFVSAVAHDIKKQEHYTLTPAYSG